MKMADGTLFDFSMIDFDRVAHTCQINWYQKMPVFVGLGLLEKWRFV
jgi:hypothetical protein